MRVKMNFKTWLFTFVSVVSINAIASIAPMDPQMVNLNIQIKGKSKIVSSDLAMPFYQTAELEKKVDDKNYYFIVNPKKGKNPQEIELEVKLYNSKKSKVIAKKDFITKINQETVISMKGVMFKFTAAI
jgi:hypothetical protein